MKQNLFIVLAMIIPFIGAPFCFMATFFSSLSDSGANSNYGAVILVIFPGVALLALLSIFLFSDLDQISGRQLSAIIIAGMLNLAELIFILSLAGITGISIHK